MSNLQISDGALTDTIIINIAINDEMEESGDNIYLPVIIR